jgi:chromosome segregation protein
MTVETVTWLYASLGASLFVLGGVALRSMAVVRARQDSTRMRGELEQARERLQTAERSREEIERAGAEARRREHEAAAALQSREAEWTQRLAAAERVAQEAKEESERLVSEVMAEDNLVRQMEASLEELRSELASTQDELNQARQATLAAEERARTAQRGVPRPPGGGGADGTALASARAELAELRRSLEAAVKERDAAKAKVEALERLVEGVRARSRELASELNRIKGATS